MGGSVAPVFTVEPPSAAPQFEVVPPPMSEGQLQLRKDLGLLPTATQEEVRNAYMGASGKFMGTAAGAMVGGTAPTMLTRAIASGVGSGAGSLAGGATPKEAAFTTIAGTIAQPATEIAGSLLSLAGKKLLSPLASKIGNWWDNVTGYAQTLEEAKNANLARYLVGEQKAAQAVGEAQQNVAAVKAAQPQGPLGVWSDLNQSIGVSPAKAIRIAKGSADISTAYGIPGRGLEAEGFTKEALQKMTPPEQAAAIGPRYQAAGKAVQAMADKATAEGSKWVPVERYSAPGGEQGYFYAPKGEAMPEFGDVKTSAQIDESNLFKGINSLEVVEKAGKLNEPIPSRLMDSVKRDVEYTRKAFVDDKYVQGLKDPKTLKDLQQWEGFGFSSEFAARQQVAEDILKAKGYKGAVWSDEDELNPKQYQIWDRSVVHGPNEKPGITFDAGKSVSDVIRNRIKDPGLQQKAIEIINSHQRELGIDNIRQTTPTQALALRQALKNEASFSPNASVDSLRGVGRMIYSAVSRDLHEAVPGMQAVDVHYGDLAQAVDAIRQNTGKYMAGKWTPPQTVVQKAEAKVPELPTSSPYTPLPAKKATVGVGKYVAKQAVPWLARGALGYGGYRIAKGLLGELAGPAE